MVEKIMKSELDEILENIDSGYNFLLTGGAGCGKTYTLVEVLKAISTKYPTKSIACITYTNAAAIEITNRANINNLFVSTIHDFIWKEISPYSLELRETLMEIVNDKNCEKIKNPSDGEFDLSADVQITYREYSSLKNGIISHDEVLILAEKMFSKYIKLRDIVKDKYSFIFVDEYQDTSPLVIKILLEYLQNSKHKNIIGFFGDSMQAIYDESIGSIQNYVDSKIVYKVEKRENRRNPQSVIDIANKLRIDDLIQVPSQDKDAPNMENGRIKEGTVKFLYSSKYTIQDIKCLDYFNGWNFEDSKQTKELRLTHNLIAKEGNFEELMQIYDKDPIIKLKFDIKKQISKSDSILDTDSFDTIVRRYDKKFVRGSNKGKTRLEVLLENKDRKKLYNHVKKWPYKKVEKIYLDKEVLLDDSVSANNTIIKKSKRDDLLKHLFKIQDIIYLYENNEYNELMKDIYITKNNDKIEYINTLNKLSNMKDLTIEEVINYAHEAGLCIIDDKLNNFINNNEYLYWRVSNLKFSIFQNLYYYLEGFLPFSTQHKIKGLEYNNVLVLLDNGNWNDYNFEYLFDKNIGIKLPSSKQKNYSKIENRTRKLFYVCCTRAKENLVIFYPNPSLGVLNGAENLFGDKNCINVDKILEKEF